MDIKFILALAVHPNQLWGWPVGYLHTLFYIERVPNRFLRCGISLKVAGRDSRLKAKCMGARFGIESMFRMWDVNNNRWDYGIERKFGLGWRDWMGTFYVRTPNPNLTLLKIPGGGALGYFWGGYVPPGTPNWHPVLKTISPKIDTPF